MKSFRRALVTSLVMTLMAAGLAVQPAAAEVDAGIDSVTEVEEAVEEVLDSTPVDELVKETAADVSDLVVDEDASDVVVELETDDGASVEIPAEADEAIVIENAEGDQLEIELPGNGDDAEVTDDGSVVYEDALPDTDIVVQAQDDGGVRMLVVIDGPDAPLSYQFPTGETPVVLADGSVVLLDNNQDVVGLVESPWAYDAEGNQVKTHYSVNGSTLTLNVAHTDGAAYPVVADPKLTTSWWGMTLKLSRSEMDKVRGSMIAGAGASSLGAIACAGATGGLCAVPWTVGVALLVIGNGALLACSNSKGVDIHRSWGGGVWCSGY